MGIGSAPAGSTLAGLDPQVLTDRAARRPPEALAFDGRARDFELDSDGLYRGVHPVDAKVFTICRTALRSIRSAPELGQGVSSLEYIEPQRIQAQVDDRIEVALKGPLDAREIRLDGVDIDTSVRGRIFFRVIYVNLVTGRRRTSAFPLI